MNNAVRFSFWGAEEAGLIGSRAYVEQLDKEEAKNIALYLNFDMLGSPNPGYFTYKAGEGSAGIHSSLSDYLKSAGKEPQDIGIKGRADDEPFGMTGVPTGGIFSGAENTKTEEQARLWGGRAGEPFDPEPSHEHRHTDPCGPRRIGYQRRRSCLCRWVTGPNGVPPREERTRRVRPCSGTTGDQPASCNCVVAISNGVPAWSCAPSI